MTIGCALVMVAGACGGSATGPSGSTAVTPPPTGPLDKSNVAALFPAQPPDPSQLGSLAAALSASDRAQVDASAVSPSIPALEAIQDQDALQVLQQLQAAQATARAPAGQVEAAVWRPPVRGTALRPSGALLANTLTLVLAIVGGALDGYDPRVDASPATLTKDFNDSSGGVETTMRVTLTSSSSAGRFTAALAIEGDTTKTDPATGAVVGHVVGSSNFVISLNPCPDAGGLVQGHIGVSDEETDSGSIAASGSTTLGFTYTGSADFTTTVNDQAEISSTHISADMDRALTSATQQQGAGPADTTMTDLGLHVDQTLTGGSAGPTDVQVTNAQGPVSEEDGRAVAGAIGLVEESPALAISQMAKSIWQGGKCFEIRPSPDGGDVGPGSKTQIKVTVYHWVDKAEVKLPVKATLAGTKTVEPSGVDQTSPATVTFTAGQPGSTGDITYRVVSKRGIGERTSHFIVQAGISVNINGTLIESTSLGRYDLKIAGSSIQVRANPDNSLTVSGTVNVSGTITFSVVPCTGKINENIPVIGQGMLGGPDDAPVFQVLLGPGSTSSLGGTVTCPVLGTIPSNAGDFFGQWSTTLGPVDLPAAGGSVTRSGSTPGFLSRSAKGTFVAKPN